MLHKTKPTDFTPNFEVSACIIQHDSEILFLKRHAHKPHPLQYGIPGGKKDTGETKKQAVIREVFEETGIQIHPDFLGTLFVQQGNIYFPYHIFFQEIHEKVDIILNPNEHIGYTWSKIEKSLDLDLVEDTYQSIKAFEEIIFNYKS